MNSDLPAIIILIALAISTFFLCGQRDMQLDAQNARISLLESQVGHANMPRIEINGRAAVYAGEAKVIVERIEE